MESYRQLFHRYIAPTDKKTAPPRSGKPLTETGWLGLIN